MSTMSELRVLGLSHDAASVISLRLLGHGDERHPRHVGSEARQGRGVRKRGTDPAPGARSRSWFVRGQAAEGRRTHRPGGARRRARRHRRLRHTRGSSLEHSSGHGPRRPIPFRSKRHARAPRPAGYVRRPLESVRAGLAWRRSTRARGQAGEGLRTHRPGGARRTARRHRTPRHTRGSSLEHNSGHGQRRPSPFRSKRHAQVRSSARSQIPFLVWSTAQTRQSRPSGLCPYGRRRRGRRRWSEDHG